MIHDHTGRAALEKGELYVAARAFDELVRQIPVPESPAELPGLVTASRQLSALSGLVNDLADEVHSRAGGDGSGLSLGPVVCAYTTASVHAGQAVADYAEAYQQLGFLHRHAGTPDSGDVSDVREAAFGAAQWRLELVHGSLHEGGRGLRGSADRLDTAPRRVLAALSRSTPANSIYRAPVPEPTRAPAARLTYTPEPRRGR
ncbi:hypothetical protein [Streptomyces qinzhouensis]|uniref:Uncharacterized protein n=1 Tax=Streptomyces qinzhouensis TaxID=2599401 RepID=A0A5B8JKX5_9ACTN|nr:hypothetical protein [Streptomyces qinzhouensis]QDY78183.1 hypothetical protein FQU76_18695 [Streptomyces qinzhouensis]